MMRNGIEMETEVEIGATIVMGREVREVIGRGALMMDTGLTTRVMGDEATEVTEAVGNIGRDEEVMIMSKETMLHLLNLQRASVLG